MDDLSHISNYIHDIDGYNYYFSCVLLTGDWEAIEIEIPYIIKFFNDEIIPFESDNKYQNFKRVINHISKSIDYLSGDNLNKVSDIVEWVNDNISDYKLLLSWIKNMQTFKGTLKTIIYFREETDVMALKLRWM